MDEASKDQKKPKAKKKNEKQEEEKMEHPLAKQNEQKEFVKRNREMIDMCMRREIGDDENPPPKRKPPRPSMERMLSYEYTKKTGGSHYYYCWVWSVAQREFRDLLTYEKKRQGIKTSDKKELFTELAEFYFMYIRLYRVMDEVYDQIAHPQKRLLVRQILDYMILRTMEIKNTLVALENSEYSYFDEIATENNWTPDETTMDIPHYYYYDQDPGVKEREQWYNELTKKAPTEEVKQEEEATPDAKKKKKFKEHVHIVGWTSGEISLTLQKYERHRQALEDYRFMVFLNEEDSREAAKKKRDKERESADKDKAATIIQKYIRGFLARKHVHRLRINEATYLGLIWGGDTVIAGWDDKCRKKCGANKKRLEFLMERRRRYRRTLEQLYQEDLIATEKRIRTFEAPEMVERLSYQLRKWMLNVKEKTGKLPDIPKAEHGGISLLVCPGKLDPEILEKGLEALDPEIAKRKKKERKKAADKKKKDAAKAKAKAKKKKKASGPQPIALGQPSFLEDMVKCNQEYSKLWRGKDKGDNPEQKHENYIIIKEKRKLVMAEVRQQVDNILRAELVILKVELDGKKKKKGKGKKGKGKKGKGKGKGKKGKGKKGKKGKKKKGKDLTPDRTFRSLYEEMISNGLIKSYPKIRLTDMFGSHSLINGTIRNYWLDRIPDPMQDPQTKFPGDANPLPSLGDVKRAIKDIAIIPMGSPTVHANGPFSKSLLIAGPNGVGKKSLVYSICTEIGATLIDLTAANIAGKYPGKPGLTMLMHLIGKVGRLAQPTIILIDNVEKMYQKKTPKTDKTEPKRLKKQMVKFLKAIGPDDLIMVIGLTNEPWKAPMKPLKKVFPKMLYIPRPDYGVRVEIWKKLLTNHKATLDSDVSASLLAKLSDGWTYDAMKRSVEVAVQAHKDRIEEEDRQLRMYNSNIWNIYESGGKKVRVGKRMIKMNEFLEALGNFDPMFLEMDKAWMAWWNKTPLMKLRLASQFAGDKKGKGKGKGKDKGKGKGKKK